MRFRAGAVGEHVPDKQSPQYEAGGKAKIWRPTQSAGYQRQEKVYIAYSPPAGRHMHLNTYGPSSHAIATAARFQPGELRSRAFPLLIACKYSSRLNERRHLGAQAGGPLGTGSSTLSGVDTTKALIAMESPAVQSG